MGEIINPYSGQKEFLCPESWVVIGILFLNDHRELLSYFLTFSYLQGSELEGLQGKNPIFSDCFFLPVFLSFFLPPSAYLTAAPVLAR